MGRAAVEPDTLIDRINFFRGIFQSVDALYPELARTNFFVDLRAVQAPVYFCLGRHDYEVPSVLVARYFQVLQAPRKQLVWFETVGAHAQHGGARERFNRFMVDTVLPGLAP